MEISRKVDDASDRNALWKNRPRERPFARSLLFQRRLRKRAQSARQILSLSLPSSPTYFQIPVHNSVMMAVVYTFQDLLNTVRGVGLAVEFPGDDVLEQFSAGDSVSVLRFNSIWRERVARVHVRDERTGRGFSRGGRISRKSEIFNSANKSGASFRRRERARALATNRLVFRLYAHNDVQLSRDFTREGDNEIALNKPIVVHIDTHGLNR